MMSRKRRVKVKKYKRKKKGGKRKSTKVKSHDRFIKSVEGITGALTVYTVGYSAFEMAKRRAGK